MVSGGPYTRPSTTHNRLKLVILSIANASIQVNTETRHIIIP